MVMDLKAQTYNIQIKISDGRKMLLFITKPFKIIMWLWKICEGLSFQGYSIWNELKKSALIDWNKLLEQL